MRALRNKPTMGKFTDIFKSLFRREDAASEAETKPASTWSSKPSCYALWENIYQGGSLALNIATVYRCVKLLSDSVAQMPLAYLKLRDSVFEPWTSSRLQYLISVQPNPNSNAFDFWGQAVNEVLLAGNAYIVPVYSRADASISALILCTRGSVSHDTENDLYAVSDQTNGVCGTFKESEIIHIKGMTLYNQKVGMSVLSYAKGCLDIAKAGDAETYERFAKGGMGRGIVSGSLGIQGYGEYQDEQIDNAAYDIGYKFASGNRVVGVPGDLKYTEMGMTSADMQFLESRKFTVREICRFFGVHPSFVYDDTSNNYKSAEMANNAFLSNTLNPLLRSIEAELNRKLIAPSLSHKYKFEFNRRDLFSCDLASKVDFYTKMIQAGIFTVNEARRLEGQQPVEGGDKVLVSANLKAIEMLSDPSEDPTNKEYDTDDGKDS